MKLTYVAKLRYKPGGRVRRLRLEVDVPALPRKGDWAWFDVDGENMVGFKVSRVEFEHVGTGEDASTDVIARGKLDCEDTAEFEVYLRDLKGAGFTVITGTVLEDVQP